MADLLAQGWLTAMVALVLCVEAAWLIRRRRMAPLAALIFVLPGAGFLLALQAALSGAHWALVALGLALAGLFHLADLRQRLR
jgi:hypothetical protein